jgi:bromodomain and PHD finger-containing protein 1
LLELAEKLKNPPSRAKRCRGIKSELGKLRRKCSIASSASAKKKLKLDQEMEEKVVNDEEVVEMKNVLPRRKVESEGSDSDSESSSSSSEDRPLVAAAKKPQAVVKRKRRRKSSGSEEEHKVDKNDQQDLTNVYPTTPSKSSPILDSATVSPSGVNRRTAVLFTRKAQAAATAFKKPSLPLGLT